MRKFLITTSAAVLAGLTSLSPALTPSAIAETPVSAYAQLPGIYDADLSPDGKFLAIVMEHKGRYMVRVVNLDDDSDKKLRASVLGEGVVPIWVQWANNDRILVNTRKNQRIFDSLNGTGSIFTANKDLTDTKVLIVQARTKGIGSRVGTGATVRQYNNTVIDMLPNDPNHILMSFSDRERFAPDVQRVNVATGQNKIQRNGTYRVQNWWTDLRGEIRVGRGNLEKNGQASNPYLTIRDAHGDTWRSADEYPGLQNNESIVTFTDNPNEIIVRRYEGKDTIGYFIYDLAQKRLTRTLFQDDNFDVSGIILSPDGKRVIGAQYVAESGQAEYFDPEAKARYDKMKALLPGYSIRIYDQTPDGSKIVLKATAPDVPASLMLYDAGTNSTRFLGADYPNLANVQQGDVKSVSYTARDGTKIPAFVTLPHKVTDSGAIKNVPFVVLPHGGPGARDEAGFDALAQFFASRGYAVLQMNFRGSTGYGRKFYNQGKEDAGVMQRDVEDGARWLIEKGYADPDRMCIAGWSYGGYAALMGAAQNPDLYKCAISMAGVTDLPKLKDDLKDYRFGATSAGNSFFARYNNSEMKQNSPTTLASQIKAPVLLAHGTDDIVVRFNQYQRMVSAMKKSDAKLTKLKLDGGDHSLHDGENRVKLYTAMDKFLKDHLGKSEYAP